VNATETIVSLEEPLLDAEQAAALLNVKPSWVREATRSGCQDLGLRPVALGPDSHRDSRPLPPLPARGD